MHIEAMTGGVLDAPPLPRWRPLDFGPHHLIYHKMVGFGIEAANLDHAVASLVCHCCLSSAFRAAASSSPFSPPPWKKRCHRCHKPNNQCRFRALFEVSHRPPFVTP